MSNASKASKSGLVAHRGFMHRYPENTWLAVHAALEAGADYIEFDLQMNADLELILIHDDNFQRTSGVSQSVFSASTDLCRDISVHHPQRFAETFKPLKISTLVEILELCARYPGVATLVEIKGESLKQWGLARVMDILLAQLEPFKKQCVLISFSAEAVEYTQQHSELKTGWVFEKYDAAHRAQAASLQADFLMTNYKLLPEGEAPWPEFAHWMLYDIVDTDVAFAYSEMGVELIETADIASMVAFFNQL